MRVTSLRFAIVVTALTWAGFAPVPARAATCTAAQGASCSLPCAHPSTLAVEVTFGGSAEVTGCGVKKRQNCVGLLWRTCYVPSAPPVEGDQWTCFASVGPVTCGTAPRGAARPLGLFGCGFETIALSESDTYSGEARGYLAGPTPGEPVTIRCYVTVDGLEATSTEIGAGYGVATTQGPVSFTATDAQPVGLCAAWSDASGAGDWCDFPPLQVPPQQVVDAVEDVLDLLGGD